MQETNINSVTFEKIAIEWLLFKKMKIKESTYLNYKFIIENKLIKEFGEKTLEELKKYNFNLYIERQMSTLSNKTIKDEISVLKGILKYTEIKYDINFKLALISAPSILKSDIEIFTERERKRLEKYCFSVDGTRELGVLLSLYAGLRIGEICALKWSDIDFENKCIYIRHTIQRVYVGKNDTKVIYTMPKTQKSIRKIPISRVIYPKLRELSKRYGKNAFVLTGDANRWVEPIGYRYTYKYILRKSRVKYRKYHTLRHTFATRCMKVGMDVKSLSEILGHANVTITLNIYVHSSFEIKNKYINRL